MLRKIRIGLATLVMVLITLLFLDFTGTLHHWLGWLAKIQFLPALLAVNVVVVVALVVLTLIMGRIYCSVICPLGILQDVIHRIGRKPNKQTYSKEKRWLRYGILVVFVAAFFLGINSLVALLAPYSSYGRIAQNLLQPIWIAGVDSLAAHVYHCTCYPDIAGSVVMAQWPYLLQYNLSGGNHPELLCPLFLAEDTL